VTDDAFLVQRSERRHEIDADPKRAGDYRSEFRRDRDRIMYCSAFRRLSGITQVISPTGSHPTHNRLTHSLEVAQIGRSLAEELLRQHDDDSSIFEAAGGLDPDVVEAAALAHDLGHPPFGHVAETTLDRLVVEQRNVPDGFEGNAQSFRILNQLAVRHNGIRGLNLTRATLSATTKYPWLRQTSGKRSKKWGAYSSDEDTLGWSREHLSLANDECTLEATLMDWADDVAYGVHDLEDFFRPGIIPLDRLATDTNEQKRLLTSHFQRNAIEDEEQSFHREVLTGLVKLLPTDPYQGSAWNRAMLRSFTSTLVNRYITAVRFDATKKRIDISVQTRAEVELLKSMTWVYVIESRALMSQRYGHARLIASLFSILYEAATSNDSEGRSRDIKIFPEFFQEQIQDSKLDQIIVVRTVADYIASMTEPQAIGLHHRLTGFSLGDALDPIVI